MQSSQIIVMDKPRHKKALYSRCWVAHFPAERSDESVEPLGLKNRGTYDQIRKTGKPSEQLR